MAEKTLKDFEVGETKGLHKLVFKHDDGVHQVWITTGGRFTVMYVGGREPFVMKSNIRSLDAAIEYIDQFKGEVTELERTVVTKSQNPYKVEKKVVSQVKSRQVGDLAYGGWVYLGGGDKLTVWASPSMRTFQIATRDPEISITSAMSKGKIDEFLQMRYDETGEEVPYQQPLPFEPFESSVKVEPIVDISWLKAHGVAV